MTDVSSTGAQAAPEAPAAFEARLRAIGAAAYHDRHPFHVLMHDGRLTRRQLQAWIENRFYYQWMIPRKDAVILAKAEDPAFRRAWRQRIVDHDGTAPGTGGIAKWLALAEAAGLDSDEVRGLRRVLPAVRFAVDAYLRLVQDGSLEEAVAASLTELFAPTLMADRVAVLESRYAWLDRRGLEYFRQRLIDAPRDAELGLRFVLERCTSRSLQDRAVAALTTKCHILWSMLDAIHFAYVAPGWLPPQWGPPRSEP